MRQPAVLRTAAVLLAACCVVAGASAVRAVAAGAAAPGPAGSGLLAATVQAGAAPAAGDLDVVLPLAGTATTRWELRALAAKPLHAGQNAALRRAAVARLAPPAAQRQQVEAWARSKGLQVSGDAWNVRVEGSAAAVARAFAVRLVRHGVRSEAGSRVHALRPTTTPAVPAVLRGAITGVLGLDTAPVLMTHHSLVSTAQMHAAYGQSVRPALGGGITVASLQLSGWDPTDAADYAGQFGIPGQQQLTQVPVDGADPQQADGTGGDEEVALDVESILGQAPSAHQRIYFADLSDNGDGTFSPDETQVLDAYDALASDAEAGLVQVASTSWGGCELDLGLAFSQELQSAITRIVAAGATFFAASGDSGARDCSPDGFNANATSVDVPASIPQTVGVGGTTLTPAGSGFSETSWDHSGSGSGGGTSVLFADTFQSGTNAARQVPDISSDADPNTGVEVVVDGSDGRPEDAQFGGTSLAAPTVAAQLADALSEAGASQGVGDIHTALYAAGAAQTRGQAAITDIVSSGGGGAAFPAAVGYDRSTGLGTPDWARLAPALGLTLSTGSTYHPVTPVRILDTRDGIGAATGQVGAGGSLTVAVPARLTGGATTETALVLNVTAVGASATSTIGVYPAGDGGGSQTSVLSVAPGVEVADLVTTRVTGGSIGLHNLAGNVDLVADIEGYYTAGLTGEGYHPLPAVRLLDTRTAIGSIRPGGSLTLQVGGAGGAPVTAAAAVLTLTSVGASAPTSVSAFPARTIRSTASPAVDAPAGVATANAMVVPLSVDGRVTIYNAGGSTQLLVDLSGYYSRTAATLSGFELFPQDPYRIRNGSSSVGAAGVVQGVSVGGLGIGAVLTDVSAVPPSATGAVTVLPAGTAGGTYQMQVRAGVSQSAAVMAGVANTGGYAGDLGIAVNEGSAPLDVDVFGYFAGPATS